IDEGGMGGAAGQGLDAHRPGASEEVGHDRPVQRPEAGQGVEDGLPHPVGGRPDRPPPRRLDATAPSRPSHDTHAERVRSGLMDGDARAAFGLRLHYSQEPPGLVATVTPGPQHRGPAGFLHGGIAALCLDETMAALGYVLDRVRTVTATLSLKYRRPVPLDGAAVRVE